MPYKDNAVVIGGSGFIGSHLTSQLREQGCSVTVVSRSAGVGRKEEPGLRFVKAGVADSAKIDEAIAGAAMEGPCVVYHLAMGGGPAWEDYQRDFIDGTLNVARACQRHGARRLIFTSSISALYLGKPGKLYERSGADPKPMERSFYSRGKILAERALLDLHAKENLPVVILRPAIVMGRGGMLAHGALGDAASDTCILGWGSGRNPLPCVLVQDVARALVLAKDAPGVEGMSFNLSGDIRPTAAQFVEILRNRTKRNFRFYRRSLLLMGSLEWMKWGLKAVTRNPNNVRVSNRDLQSLTMAADLDCSEAKRMLGWNPTSDPEEFYREAIQSHLQPIPQGDLRVKTEAA